MSFSVTVGLKPQDHPFYNRGSKYCFYIDGAPGKKLSLTPGTEYHFTINTPGHPFYFTTSEAGGSEDNNILPSFSPTEKGEVTFTMPTTYPDNFYYQCKIHQYMGSAVRKIHTPEHHTFYLNPILIGLVAPTSLAAPNGENALYVADQIGIVYRYDLTTKAITTFLDVTEYIPKLDPYYEERGVLGLCFHPNYLQNGRFFIYYSSRLDRSDQQYESGFTGYYNCLSEFNYKDGKIQYQAEKVILRIKRDLNYHNGGKIGFGLDGYLYITVGDGGPQKDPQGHAQNLGVLFGKILRIDVNGVESYPYYQVPQDNPFINVPNARPEIWAYGFRNPWGLEFFQNILIVTDAGLDAGTGQEKVNIVVKGGNYGWNIKEGTHLAPWVNPNKVDISNMVDPVFAYTTGDPKFADNESSSVIVGGYLTKARDYICADFSGRLIRLRFNQTKTDVIEMASIGKWIRSFGKDAMGNLYVLASQNQGPLGNTGEVQALTVV